MPLWCTYAKRQMWGYGCERKYVNIAKLLSLRPHITCAARTFISRLVAGELRKGQTHGVKQVGSAKQRASICTVTIVFRALWRELLLRTYSWLRVASFRSGPGCSSQTARCFTKRLQKPEPRKFLSSLLFVRLKHITL